MRAQFLTISAALLSSSLASPAGAAPLQPSENWGLDYGQTQCTAARSFGNASSPTVLGVVPSFSGNSYVLMVSVPKQGPDFAKQSAGTVDFGQGPISALAYYYGKHGVNQSVYQFRLSAAEMAQAKAANAVSVTAGRDSYSFALSNMPELLDGLAKCTASLHQYWNSDGAGTKSFAKSAISDLETLFTAKDYPAEAAARRQYGEASYQILIDEKGAIAACDVLTSSGVPSLDETGCEVLKERGKFTPAMGAAGKPIKSVVTTQRIGWTANGIQTTDNGCTSGNTALGSLGNCGRGNTTTQLGGRSSMELTAPPPPPSSH